MNTKVFPLSNSVLSFKTINNLVGDLPKPAPARLLFVSCGLKIHFPWEKAVERHKQAINEAREATKDLYVEIVDSPNPFEDPSDLLNFADNELGQGLAGVIFFHATYTAGEIGSQFGRWLLEHHLPVLSWAWPEKGNAGRNEANSLTCQNFILNMWRQLGVKYQWMHKNINSDAHPTLEVFSRAIFAKSNLKNASVLHAGGSRVTAFYDGEVDELAVMKSMGLRFDRFDLETIFQHSQKFSDKDIGLLVKELKAHPDLGMVDLPDKQIYQTYRFGLAMLDLARENHYLGATVKSWPDLFDCYGCAIDGSVSMMNDYGFCVAEEGEMNGIISSLAIKLLSESKANPGLTTMMDLSLFREIEDRLGIWHCGASPTRMKKAGSAFNATKHSILENGDPENAVGLMLEFILESGPVTLMRYQSPKAGEYFAFEGEFVETELAYRGSYGLFKSSDKNISINDIMGTILSSGLDHHWSLAYGHWKKALDVLNYFLGIQSIPLVKHSDASGFGLHL